MDFSKSSICQISESNPYHWFFSGWSDGPQHNLYVYTHYKIPAIFQVGPIIPNIQPVVDPGRWRCLYV